MKTGRLRQDDACHLYFIPDLDRERFRFLLEIEDHDTFEDEFRQYRLEMHPAHYVWTMESADE